MEKYKLNILLAAFLLFITSCENKLELLPEDDIADELVFTNKSTALGAVLGIYNRAQQDDVLNGTLQFMTEWQSDNVAFEGTFSTFEEVSVYSTLATNTSIFSIWDDNYETIGAANLVIDNILNVPGDDFTDAERIQAIAEARFMRALVYFNISTVFGQPLQVAQGRSNLNVPLVVSSETGLEIPRSDIGEIHDFVESELLAVIPILADGTRSKANPGAARALLARLYLYQERWSEAADMANMLISDSFYSLASDYSFFNEPASSEHIFTIINNAVDGQDTNQGFSGLSNPQPEGRGDTPFTQDLLDAYAEEPGDLRFASLNQEGPGAISPNAIFTTKFDDGVNNADDAPVIRITEMYLTRAEANLRAGTNVGDAPLNDINALRNRAGLVDLAEVTLDIILNERRKELAFEGHRRMDLMRNGLNLRRDGQPQVAASVPGADRTIFPIPQRVRDLSPFVEQNPNY